MKRFSTLCICMLFSILASSTIIKPFEDLGELVQQADEIIIAHVVEDLFHEGEEMTHFSWNLQILQSYKNQITTSSLLELQGESTKSETLFNKVYGDIKLEVGQTYMIFLNKKEDGSWVPMTMSYYVYQIKEKNQELFWVPSASSLDMCTYGRTDALFVMNSKKTDELIQQHIDAQYAQVWDDNALMTEHEVMDFYPALKARPAHCTNVFDGFTCGGNPVEGNRWTQFPTGNLEIWIDQPNQVETPTSNTIMSNATGLMNASYLGINLAYQGIVGTDYVPNCMGGTVQNSTSNFFPYSNGLNGTEQILVVFNDPCEQITDMVSCNGTIAIGGLYGTCGGLHTHDGEDYMSGMYGYVVFNDDMVNGGGTACLSDAAFEIVGIHEMTHSLSIGHIDPADGTANMNPSCCNSIGALDVECLDHLYPVGGVVPVTWLGFDGETRLASNDLSWQTASEVNNDYFEIEFSSNGREFTKIEEIKGAGNFDGLSEYTFEDFQNLGSKAFYRIKQVDFDGTFTYSDVISLRRKVDTQELLIYPNPAQDELYLITNLEGTKLRVFNALGKEQIVQLSKLSDANAKLDISNLQGGVYFLELYSEGNSTIKSFIKS